MPPLRLVMIARRFWPLVGGTERLVANLATEMVARGAEVALATTRWQESWPSRIDYRGVKVTRLPRTGDGFLGTRLWMRNLSQYLRDCAGSYDAVYVCDMRYDSYVALKTVDRRRVAVALRTGSSGRDGDCLWQLDTSFGRQIKRQAMKADALVGTSEIAHRELIASGYPRDRIRCIFGGVPIPALPDPQAKTAARQALEGVNTLLHCPPAAPVAVYTGTLDAQADAATAIEAWRAIAQRWPNARLWLVGADANQSELNRRIEAANLVGRVVIPGVFADVTELHAAADAVIVAEPREGSPFLLLEAMAAGLPVAAADVPEYRCVAGAGHSADFFRPGDSQQLGGILTRAFDDIDRARQKGAAARAFVEAEYDIGRAVDAHLQLLSGLVENKRSAKQS